MAKFTANTPLPKLKALYTKAKDAYYNDPNGRTVMSDDEYDALEDLIRKQEPKWPGLKATGIKTKNKKTKVKLTVPMASLDKVKAHSVEKWLEGVSTPQVVISDKKDGSSLQLTYKDGVPTQLVTRGDGVIGGDVSFLIPHLKIPQRVGKINAVLRCEGIFSKSAFLKYKTEFDAARNAASGIFNRQDIHRATKDLTIFVLKVLLPPVKPSQGLAWAKSKGFSVVPYKVVPTSKLNAENLTKLLAKRKATSKYHLDGIVIEEDKINKPTKDKPDWAVAFKENVDVDQAPVTTVTEVLWDVSSRAQIIPRVKFKPVVFDGAKVQYCSGFNAKFINENGIGPGAKIAVLRSGDIIPYLAKVVKKAKPSKPDPREVGPYELDKRGTNYILTDPRASDAFKIQRILKFMKTVGVDFIKAGVITKLYELGFKNIKAYVQMTPDQLIAKGVTPATANKLAGALRAALDKGIPLPVLMDASGVFPHGMGQTRFEAIAQHYPLMKLAEALPEEQYAALSKIKGFGSSITDAFVKGAPKFVKWMSIVQIKVAKPKKVKLDSTKLAGVHATWTGYRDKHQEQLVTENGGTVVPFGGKTTVLLVSPSGKASSKADKARERNVPVLTWDQFKKKYAIAD